MGPLSDWTRLRFEAATPPQPALGTRVEVRRGDMRLRGHVALVEGFQSQVDSDVHFGLGPSQPGVPIDVLEIEWPSGETQTFNSVMTNQLISIHETTGQL